MTDLDLYLDATDYCPDIDISIPRADRIKDRIAELTAQVATKTGADKFCFDFEFPDTECLVAYANWKKHGMSEATLGSLLAAIIEWKLKQAATFEVDEK